MERNKLVIVVFNAKLSDGCDYATQSLAWLGKRANTYGLVLGEPIRWIDLFSKPIIEHAFSATLLHPIFLLPGQRVPLIKKMNMFIFFSVINVYFYMKYGHMSQKVLWIFEPDNIAPFLWIFRGYTTLYDSVDYQGSRGKALDIQEKKLLRTVALVTCVSQTLATLYRRTRKDVTVVPLGFNPRSFLKPKKYSKPHDGLCTVGFVGAINSRLDFELLEETVRALPNFRFVFVGPIQESEDSGRKSIQEDMRTLLSYPNVVHVGEFPKERLSGYLRDIDVGIIPYDVSQPFNAYSHPMKLLDYFWFGKPVVATALPELKRYIPYVTLAENSKGFIRALHKSRSRSLSKYAYNARRAVVQKNTWEKKLSFTWSRLSAAMP